MVYSDNRRSYVTTTGILDAMGLNVVDARIIPVGAEHHLNTYCVLDDDGQQIADRSMLAELKSRLERALADGAAPAVQINRRMRRQLRVFSTPVQISMSRDALYARTVVELVAADRPGLLYQVGRVFDSQGLVLQNARVATIGERAEDVFFVSTHEQQPLDESQCEQLRAALIAALSEPGAKN
jgi:[protein-PII] uridylyltransferase